jgi:2'-5' RNA ligase
MPLRLFVAINPPEAVRERIGAGTAELRRLDGVRWVDPDALHITLKFIDALAEGRADEVAASLRRVAAGHAPFDVELSGVGAFPSLRRPRVVWVGIGPIPKLARLHREIEAALEELGIEREERGFSAHITLGRVRRGSAVDARRLESFARRAVIGGSWRVESVELMESCLRPTGAVYEVRESASLAGCRAAAGG